MWRFPRDRAEVPVRYLYGGETGPLALLLSRVPLPPESVGLLCSLRETRYGKALGGSDVRQHNALHSVISEAKRA